MFGEWSQNLTQLNSYMHSGKHFVRAGLVMAPYPCGLVDVTSRVYGLRFKEALLVLNGMVQNM